MFTRVIWSGLVLVALAVGVRADQLKAKPLSTFDGKSWSGIELDRMTDADIKKTFETSKRAVRPEALLMSTGLDGVRVDVLMDGRGAKAVARAIRVEYDRPPKLSSIQSELGIEPKRLYQPNRNENWHLSVFDTKGIIAVCFGEGDLESAASFFLVPPNAVNSVVREFTEEVSEVVPVFDPGRDWDRIPTFGQIYSDAHFDDPKIPNELAGSYASRLQDDMDSEARSIRRPIRYERGAASKVTIKLNVGRFNEKWEATAEASISTTIETPYGRFPVSGSYSQKIQNDYRKRIWRVFDQAFENFTNEVERKIRSLGPPPVDQARKSAIERLMDLATGIKRK